MAGVSIPASTATLGIDYSRPRQIRIKPEGLRAYMADLSSLPHRSSTARSPRKYWDARGIASAAKSLSENNSILIGSTTDSHFRSSISNPSVTARLAIFSR